MTAVAIQQILWALFAAFILVRLGRTSEVRALPDAGFPSPFVTEYCVWSSGLGEGGGSCQHPGDFDRFREPWLPTFRIHHRRDAQYRALRGIWDREH